MRRLLRSALAPETRPITIALIVGATLLLVASMLPAFPAQRLGCVSFDAESAHAEEEERSLDRLASTMVGEPGTADALSHGRLVAYVNPPRAAWGGEA
jgi:hypothetical protein